MEYIDYGLSVISKEILMNYPENQVFDLADVYHKLSNDRLLAGLEVFERFYEIGSIEGLLEAEKFLVRSIKNELFKTTY